MTVQEAPVMVPQVAAEQLDALGARDEILHNLLGPDYDYATQPGGLVDMFYYDPATGEDGLIHTLAGDFKPGTTIPRGFHHPPSAEAAWPTVRLDDGTEQVVTRVVPGTRPRPPMEPSKEHVVIGGLQKMIPQKKPDGEWELVHGKYGMFPSEYDALAVMQAIRIARDTRELGSDEVRTMQNSDRQVILAKGHAPLIDGKSFMKIKMVLDAATGKVISAYPQVGKKPIMNLTEDEMWHHIMGL